MKLEIVDVQKAQVFRGIVDKSIFTWDDVTRLLNLKRFNWIDIIQNNITLKIPRIRTYWEGVHLDRKFINKKINEGAGIVLQGLSSYNEALVKISNSIEESLSQAQLVQGPVSTWSVDVHCYCGLETGKHSFRIHTDKTANFIMQLDGISKWTVYKDRSNGKTKTIPSDDSLTKDIQVDLQPGDVLYIPQNAFHYCLPQTKRLSLSFAAMPGIKNEPERRTYYKYG